ncbi:hypothetical protein JW887_01025 [Candidatus Dojkabacteria bacterium]|nr:hypothetical protein [Candidatus Dojkabacteria bacterium]
MLHKYFNSEPSKAELWYYTFDAAIDQLVKVKNWLGARKLSMEWANGITSAQRLKPCCIWKGFKRNVAAKWFKEPDRKFFMAKWKTAMVLQYAFSFDKRNIRISQFPKDIACHSKSIRLNFINRSNWYSVITHLDRNIPIEVFPESCTDSSICFRVYYSAFGENIIYEAGLEQAMLVFENEQGQHPFVSSMNFNNNFSWEHIKGNKGSMSDIVLIEHKLEKLMDKYRKYIETRCFGLCRSLGIEQIAIEGYYDDNATQELTIVDIDLPFDYVYMQR